MTMVNSDLKGLIYLFLAFKWDLYMAIDCGCDLLLSVAFSVGQSAKGRGLWTSLDGL